jgi:hypothetical protein
VVLTPLKKFQMKRAVISALARHMYVLMNMDCMALMDRPILTPKKRAPMEALVLIELMMKLSLH